MGNFIGRTRQVRDKSMNLLKKLRGDSASLPAMPDIRSVITAWFGGVLTIAMVAGLSDILSTALVLGSFGASCVLIFGYPDVPFSQPRNVIFGHLISSAVGLLCMHLFGPTWWSVAIAVGTAIAMMMITRTVHPPAGSNPVIVFLGQPGWGFLLFPTLVGAVCVVLLALVYNNVTRKGRYPKYW